MKVVRTIIELKNEISIAKSKGCSVGFVPTMGALHIGHISLVEQCIKDDNYCVVSIFVNPTQFNDPKDLDRYPRTEREDLDMLEAAGCNLVFAPVVNEVYPEEDKRVFEFDGLDRYMEGSSRPGHFNGVAQVVSRLFDMVEPTRAYFGEKDFQQLAIIRRMTRDLSLPIEIVGCPIKRADDGLALSSRNTLLSSEHRNLAPSIYKALSDSLSLASIKSIKEVEEWVCGEIAKHSEMTIEYYTICNGLTLKPAEEWSEEGGTVGCIAVKIGGIRLIDNIKYF